MTRTGILAVFAAALVPAAAMAQAAQASSNVVVQGSAAVTRVFRAEDESFGLAFSPGIGFEWRPSSRLGLGIELNRVAGLKPRTITCGSVVAPSCSGSGREGVLAATLGSVTTAWYFGSPASVQPYLVGGVDVLASRSVSTTTFGNGAVTIVESEGRDTGYGVTAGAGFRVPVGPRLSIRPEFRIYDGAILGRANLAALRISVALASAF